VTPAGAAAAQAGYCHHGPVDLAIPGCPVVDAAGTALHAAAGGVLDGIAGAIGDGMASATTVVVSFWVHVPVPGLSTGSGPVAELRSGTAWLTAWVAVLCVLVAGGRVALSRSGRPAADAFRGLGLLVVLSGAGVAAVQLLVTAGDGYSQWILDRSAGGDLGTRLAVLSSAPSGLGAGLLIVVGLLGMLAALAQLGLMIVRVGVVTLFAGLLPLAAAGAGTETGMAWLRKVLSWLLAFVLYKPVAATVYASAFFMIGKGDDVVSVLSGLSMLVLSVLALPALMRLVTPAVGAAVGAAAGGGAAAAVTAGVATGARVAAARGAATAALPRRPAGPGGPSGGAAAALPRPTPAGAGAGAGGAVRAAGPAGVALAAAGAARGAAGRVVSEPGGAP